MLEASRHKLKLVSRILCYMKLKNLKEEHLVEILRLYESKCGFGREFERAMYQSPEMVLRCLKKQGTEEYRIGSKWDGHSKIYFETGFNGDFVVKFNPNLDPRDRNKGKYDAAEKAGVEFVKAAMEYLSQQ